MSNSGTLVLTLGAALTGRARLIFSSLAIHTTLGALFCWTVFLGPLREVYGWAPATALTPYRYALIWFTIGLFVASQISRRHSPRTLTRMGSFLMVAGCLLAAVKGTGISGLTTGIGVLGGFGAGVAYFAPISTFRHWLPPRGNWFQGLSVAGFVAGTLLSSLLVEWILSRPGSSAAASLEAGFLTLALLFAVGVACVGELLPHTRAWLSPDVLEALNHAALPAEVLRERAWERSVMPLLRLWLEWSIFFIGLLASLGAVGDRIPILGAAFSQHLGVSAGIGVIVLGLTNHFGSALWKRLTQRIGGIYAFLSQAAIAAGLGMIFGRGHFDWRLTMASLGVIGFGLGGFLGLMPQFAAEMLDRRESATLRFAISFSALGLCGTIAPFWLNVAEPGTLAGNLSQLSFVAALLLGFFYLLLRPIRTGSTVSDALSRW
ncbi:MAG: MFS transporter [Bryobacterales bacterium]|nr:MFS transporter [Bryobacterales bacterium]